MTNSNIMPSDLEKGGNHGDPDESSLEAVTFNPFESLPYEMLVDIFSRIDSKKRQQIRKVCRLWKHVIDTFHGIHLHINNMNWNSLEDCDYAISAKFSGFTRDILYPDTLASRLVIMEISDFIAYYSLIPLLKECSMLESLIINCVSFLPKSRLPEYSSPEYFEKDGKLSWLPKLKHFKFISITTQTGVYNHIGPSNIQDENAMDDSMQILDVSRGEMEFIPLIIRILMNSKSLSHVEMVLTDIWKIPFADLLHVDVDAPPLNTDISLWHFGSKRLLPVGALLNKVNTLTSMSFSFPHHLNNFYMKFMPLSTQQLANRNEPYQLEEAVVQQSLRWSQEMREVDTPWLQILENQFHLTKLEYPFPISGNEQRMAEIIKQNRKTLESITFVGHRESHGQERVFGVEEERTPWNAEWFSDCDNLLELLLKCHTRLIGPTGVITKLIKPNLLPQSLKTLVFHGCIDTGTNSLCVALCSLVNLRILVHQARLCPWYVADGVSVSELQVDHVKEILVAIPQLKVWKLEWCDPASAIITHFVLNPEVVRQSAIISSQVFDWMKSMKGSIDYQDINQDRQMKGVIITIHAQSELVKQN